MKVVIPYKNTIVVLTGLLVSLCNIFAQSTFEVNPLPFNTRDYDEFAPVVFQDGLVFCTYRTQHVYRSTVGADEKTTNDLYFVQKKGDSWGDLQFFSKELNTKNHEGKCTFTKDGKTIYLTRFWGAAGDSTGYIYRANKFGDDWGNQVLISLNSNEYRIKDPCLSPDGKKMYFASRAPGGYGGYDIYVSTFEKGDWGAPRNLGPLVNTKGDEVSPFIHANGKLYFSSNKLPEGLGKFDIYYTREINGKWIQPKHLSAPINSNRDDRYYISDAGDTTGYFSSNRKGSFDIYSFRSLWPKYTDCHELEINDYTYEFREKGSVDTDTTSFLYEWDFGDSTKSRGKSTEVQHTFPSTGQYMVQLNVIDTLTGEIQLNEAAYSFEVKDVEQAYIACSDTLLLNTSAKFDATLTNLPDFKVIAGYYWDFGDGELANGISLEHVYYQPGKYSVRLAVVSSPDENGVEKKYCVYKEVVVIPSP